ncbi:chalcone isomerase family protein [Zoogloea sp.]|uniref:chalcone isomerase family protein n=1 Tax=Zoogloea sp. TaxID=49181 RepID=UPI002585C983|nr:chalcone isomerase family protein [Zoogloea sp.]MDD2669724.1 chalcone isomerase family protein [Zoogloea sp.]
MKTVLHRHLRQALLATALIIALPAHAADIAGVRFDDKATVAGSELVLNGAGLRTRFMLKIYAIGLYLPKRADSAEAVSTTSGPRRIQIVTLRELTAEQFADALVEGLKKNHSETEFIKLQARADDFRNALLSLKTAPNGSQIRLEWLPGSGTRLSVGNEIRGKDIPGEDFFRALLRIWLGDKPIDQELKNALLGKV